MREKLKSIRRPLIRTLDHTVIIETVECQKRCDSDKNGIRTHNHLVRKRTLNHLAKLALKLHLNFRYDACFEQGVPWHAGKLSSVDSLWTRTWRDNKIKMLCSLLVAELGRVVFM